MKDRRQIDSTGMLSKEAPNKEAARQLRAILEAVDRGELNADAGVAKRLVRRLEGALAVLEMDLKAE